MALARICDRCKRVYSKNEHEFHVDIEHAGHVKGMILMFEEADDKKLAYPYTVKNAYFDLCPSCSKELTEFIMPSATTNK